MREEGTVWLVRGNWDRLKLINIRRSTINLEYNNLNIVQVLRLFMSSYELKELYFAISLKGYSIVIKIDYIGMLRGKFRNVYSDFHI
jgi:hypothetical protein